MKNSEDSDFSSLLPPVFPADSFEEARLKGALGAAVETAVETAVEVLPALMLLDMRLYPAWEAGPQPVRESDGGLLEAQSSSLFVGDKL